MEYRFVTEPLASSENTIEMLLKEIVVQTAMRIANPLNETELDGKEDFNKEAQTEQEHTTAIKSLMAEITQRFQKLEQRTANAERDLLAARNANGL